MKKDFEYFWIKSTKRDLKYVHDSPYIIHILELVILENPRLFSPLKLYFMNKIGVFRQYKLLIKFRKNITSSISKQYYVLELLKTFYKFTNF